MDREDIREKADNKARTERTAGFGGSCGNTVGLRSVPGRPEGASATPHNNSWIVRPRSVSRHAHGYMTHLQFHMRQYAAIRERTSTGHSTAVPTAQDCIPSHVSTCLCGRAARVRDVKKGRRKSM